MNVSYSYQVCSVFSVVLIEVRNVLEVVCVNVAICCSNVWLYIVIELDDFECPSLFSESVRNGVEDLCVRCRRSSYLDCLVCRITGICGFTAVASAAACCEDAEREYENCC